MTSASQPLSSALKQQEPCCFSKLLSSFPMQITLFVVGVLAIVAGQVYLTDMPRMITMGTGSILLALLVIGVCRECCYSPKTPPPKRSDKMEDVRAANDAKSSTETEQPRSKYYCYDDATLNTSLIGQALLIALKQSRPGVTDCSYMADLGSGMLTKRQGFAIYFQDTSQAAEPPVSVLLIPCQQNEESSIDWQTMTNDHATYNKIVQRYSDIKDGILLLSIISDTHPRVKLLANPDANQLAQRKMF